MRSNQVPDVVLVEPRTRAVRVEEMKEQGLAGRLSDQLGDSGRACQRFADKWLLEIDWPWRWKTPSPVLEPERVTSGHEQRAHDCDRGHESPRDGAVRHMVRSA